MFPITNLTNFPSSPGTSESLERPTISQLRPSMVKVTLTNAARGYGVFGEVRPVKKVPPHTTFLRGSTPSTKAKAFLPSLSVSLS